MHFAERNGVWAGGSLGSPSYEALALVIHLTHTLESQGSVPLCKTKVVLLPQDTPHCGPVKKMKTMRGFGQGQQKDAAQSKPQAGLSSRPLTARGVRKAKVCDHKGWTHGSSSLRLQNVSDCCQTGTEINIFHAITVSCAPHF